MKSTTKFFRMQSVVLLAGLLILVGISMPWDAWGEDNDKLPGSPNRFSCELDISGDGHMASCVFVDMCSTFGYEIAFNPCEEGVYCCDDAHRCFTELAPPPTHM